MNEKEMTSVGLTDILIDTLNKKYTNISDLNSLMVNLSDVGREELIPVIESILDSENETIGKLQKLIDMFSDSEDSIEKGKQDTLEIIDGNNEFLESCTSMKDKLVLSENFDNVIDDVQAVADPVFVGANEEHDENKKKYEDAMDENKKIAEETIPKEGDDGTDIKSSNLKKMHLSEKLFESWEEARPNEAKLLSYVEDGLVSYDALCDNLLSWFSDDELGRFLEDFIKDYDIYSDDEEDEYVYVEESLTEARKPKYVDTLFAENVKNAMKSGELTWDNVDEWNRKYNGGVDPIPPFNTRELMKYFRSLEESISRYSDVVPLEDRRYWYFTTHGVQPGSIPSDLNVLEVKDGRNENGTLGTYVCLDGILNTSELKKYDMVEKVPLEESLQVEIAKEQLKRFKEGKMSKNFDSNVFIEKLEKKNFITKNDAIQLKEWYNSL